MARHRIITRGKGESRRSVRVGASPDGESDAATVGSAEGAPATWGRRQRILLTVGIVGVLAAWMVFLLSRPGLPYRTHLIEFWSPDNSAHLGLGLRSGGVPLTREEEPGGAWIHTLEFEELLPLPHSSLRSVDLLLDVRHDDPGMPERPATAHLLRAQLRDLTDGSSLRVGEPGRMRTEDLLVFLRSTSAEVGPAEAGSAVGPGHHWRLELQTREKVALALRSLVGPPSMWPASTNGGALVVKVPVSGSKEVRWAYPHGRFTTWSGGNAGTRAGLLASLWDQESAGWVWAWVGVSMGLIGVGVWWIPIGVGPGLRRRAGGSVAMIFAGCSLGYALLTPPFLGIDEVPHVFSYHVWQHDEDAVKAAWDLGFRTHFARMMSRPHQKFTAADLGHPHPWFIAHPSTMDTHPGARSALAARLWRGTRFWISGGTAASQIWRLRLISLFVATLGVGLGAWGLAGGGVGETPVPALGWWILLVPSLPFFAMNVSNYPLLIGLYAVIAAGIARMVNSAVVPVRVLGVLGLGYGLAVHTSINAIPLGGLMAASLAGWFLGREPRGPSVGTTSVVRSSSRWLGWVWFGAGLWVSRWVATPEFDGQMSRVIGPFWNALGLAFRPPIWWVILTGALIPAGIEWALAKRPVHPAPLVADPRARPRGWVTGLALVPVLALAFNAVMPAPQLPGLHEAIPLWDFVPDQGQLLPLASLPPEPETNPPVRRYVLGAVKSFLASWGPGDADFMLSRLFWQENGYLDSLAPEWERQILTTFFGLGAALLLWRITQRSQWVRLIRLVAVLAGSLVALVVYAYAARAAVGTPSLHGRYLMGLYLVLLAVCFLGWKGVLVQWQERGPGRLAFLLAGVPVVLHAASYATLLDRYFGH